MALKKYDDFKNFTLKDVKSNPKLNEQMEQAFAPSIVDRWVSGERDFETDKKWWLDVGPTALARGNPISSQIERYTNLNNPDKPEDYQSALKAREGALGELNKRAEQLKQIGLDPMSVPWYADYKRKLGDTPGGGQTSRQTAISLGQIQPTPEELKNLYANADENVGQGLYKPVSSGQLEDSEEAPPGKLIPDIATLNKYAREYGLTEKDIIRQNGKIYLKPDSEIASKTPPQELTSDKLLVPDAKTLQKLSEAGVTENDIVREDGKIYLKADSKHASILKGGVDDLGIDFRPGLTDNQKQTIIDLIQNKPREQWTSSDIANYNFATNSSEGVISDTGQTGQTGTGPTGQAGTGQAGQDLYQPDGSSPPTALDKMSDLVDNFFTNIKGVKDEAKIEEGIGEKLSALNVAQAGANDTLAKIEQAQSDLELQNILNEEAKIALQNKISGENIPMSVINAQLSEGLKDMDQAQRLDKAYDIYALNTQINLYNAQLRNVDLLNGQYQQAQDNVQETVDDWVEWQGMKLNLLEAKGALEQEARAKLENEIAYERELMLNGYTHIDNTEVYDSITKELGITAGNFSQFIYKDPANGKMYLKPQEEKQKLRDEGINQILLSAIQNGADKQTAQKIRNSKSISDAIINASDYLKISSTSTPEKIGTDSNGNDLYYDPTSQSVVTGKELVNGFVGKNGIKSPSGNTYDMSTYADDERHPQSVQNKINEIGKFNKLEDIDSYIKSKYKNSPVTGQMVSSVSSRYGIGWEELVGLVDHESYIGTSNVAKNNNNPGGITWNANFPEDMKGTARPGIEGGHYVKFDTMEEGLASVAYELAKRKVDTVDVETEEFNVKDYEFIRQKVNNNTGAADAAKTVVRDFTEALNRMDDPLFANQSITSASQRAIYKNVPGHPVKEIDDLIESAKSNIGIDKLLEIKASGAGLGQVPQSQLITLQSVLGRMDVTRDPELLKRDINEAIQKYNNVIERTTAENDGLIKQYPQYSEMLNLDVNTDTAEPDISDISFSIN